MKMLPRILIPLVISALALWAATRNVKWEEIVPILKTAKAGPFAWGFLISLIGFYLRAVRWQILLKPFQRISIWALLRWQIGGIVVNNLLPLRMGEVARAYWAGHKSSIPKTTVLATIVLERVLDAAALAVIVLILLLFLGLAQAPEPSAKNISLALAALAAAIFTFKALMGTGGRQIKKFLPAKLVHIWDNFFSGLNILKSRGEMFRLAVISPLIWCSDIWALAVMSRCLDLNLSWVQGGLTLGGLVLGLMIPALPGAVGTYEAGGVKALSLLGFDPTLAFSFVALLHVAQMAFMFVLGIPTLMIEGFNPKKMYQEMNSEPRSGIA